MERLESPAALPSSDPLCFKVHKSTLPLIPLKGACLCIAVLYFGLLKKQANYPEVSIAPEPKGICDSILLNLIKGSCWKREAGSGGMEQIEGRKVRTAGPCRGPPKGLTKGP